MTFVTIPALLVALSAHQAPLVPVSTPVVRTYQRPVTATPPYHWRQDRRVYSSSSSRDNYLHQSGLTFTIRSGYHDAVAATDGMELLKPRGSFGYTFGYNISPFVNVGLGLDGLFYGADCSALGPVKGVGQLNLTMDMVFRLIRPSDRRYLVPFLQVGMGLALLSGTVTKTETSTGPEGEVVTSENPQSRMLARGGIFQVGGGLEIFLSSFVSLNVRALYRVQPMSGVRCVEGAACDPSRGAAQQNVQGFVADAGLTLHFGSLIKKRW